MGSAAYDFEGNYVEVAGHRLHYLDEGDGDPIVFLHGNPQWTYGWRNVVPLVSPNARVIAPDMIGMGLSDKPDIPYSFFLHLGYIDRFLDAIELDRFVLAVHDWGSALGLSLAMRRPQQIRGMVLMETFTVGAMIPPEAQGPAAPWGEPVVEWCMRFIDPDEGPRLVLEEDRFNDTVQLMTKRTLSEEEMAGYRSPYPTPESRRAQLAWVHNALGAEDRYLGNHAEFRHSGEFLLGAEFPKLLPHCAEGMISDHNVAWYGENLANVEIVRLGDGYHYIQEDQPEALGNAIAAWLVDLPA